MALKIWLIIICGLSICPISYSLPPGSPATIKATATVVMPLGINVVEKDEETDSPFWINRELILICPRGAELYCTISAKGLSERNFTISARKTETLTEGANGAIRLIRSNVPFQDCPPSSQDLLLTIVYSEN
jgi:hypothetical protein